MSQAAPDQTFAIDLAHIRTVAERIRPHIRRTPILNAGPARVNIIGSDTHLTFKLECLQITGSFKARGAMSKLTSLDDKAAARGLVTASGGNHGLGVAYAAWQAGIPAHVFLPETTPGPKVAAFRQWGTKVHLRGAVWDDANEAATAAADRDGMTYIHPFADPEVAAGQGTLALEILADCGNFDTLLVAIGGGGLISGIAIAAKALQPDLKIIGVEPVGAPTLQRSVAAGSLVTLDKIDTAANTLAPRRSAAMNLAVITALVDDIVLVGDPDMQSAAAWLWSEYAVAAELSGAATTAALQSGAYRPESGERMVALVCGAGKDGIAV